MPDLANKNMGHPVKTESQINKESFYNINMTYAIYGTHLYF